MMPGLSGVCDRMANDGSEIWVLFFAELFLPVHGALCVTGIGDMAGGNGSSAKIALKCRG